MGSIPAIQYTQEQARAITGVSSQALRHWRKVIPYLAEKSGKAARFSFADLIGLSAIQQVIDRMGVSVGNVQAGIESLLRILATTRLSELQNAVLLIGVDSAEVRRLDELSELFQSKPVLLVPCDPLLEQLRGYVLPDLNINPQMNLPFPPQAVQR
jgi:hypothetical protein